MKHLLAALLFIPFALSAQISVDRSDFGNIGDSVFLYGSNDLLDTLFVSPAGSGQVWDFSFLSVDSFPDTLLFLDTAGFAQAQLVPNANLVLKDGPSLQFIEENSNAIYVHSLTLDFDTFLSNVAFFPQPRLTLFDFPVQFGQVVTGTYSANSITIPFQDTLTVAGFSAYVDSIRISPSLEKIDSANASGTLLLPDQKSYDVIRQKSTLIISLSLEVLIPNPLFPPFPPPTIWFQIPSGSIPNFETSTYNYLAKGKKYPILELTSDSLNAITSARFQLDTAGNDTLTVLLPEWEQLEVYPNPSSGTIKVENMKEDAILEVLDPVGRRVIFSEFKRDQNTIDISALPRGIYILKVEGMESGRISQIRVLKE